MFEHIVYRASAKRRCIEHLYRTWEEFVNTLPKVVGFLRVLRFLPTAKVDREGKD